MRTIDSRSGKRGVQPSSLCAFRGGRIEHRRIARPAGGERPRHAAAGDALDRVNHLSHRMRLTRPQVVRARLPCLDQDVERPHVGIGQIGHVDIVAQAGSVRRRIIVAEHLQARAPGRRLDGARNHVNLGRMIFADLPVRIRARGIEISERHRAQAVRALEMRQRPLDGELGFSVAVDRMLRMRLRESASPSARRRSRTWRRARSSRTDSAAIASSTPRAPITLLR